MLSKYAILLDGGFVTKKLQTQLKRFPLAADVKCQTQRQALKIKFDKKTGLPYFAVLKDAPPMTDEWVKQQLSEFP